MIMSKAIPDKSSLTRPLRSGLERRRAVSKLGDVSKAAPVQSTGWEFMFGIKSICRSLLQTNGMEREEI